LKAHSPSWDVCFLRVLNCITTKNGMRFDNYYGWVVYFKDEVIVKVRSYLDSAMVARLFEENPIAA